MPVIWLSETYRLPVKAQGFRGCHCLTSFRKTRAASVPPWAPAAGAQRLEARLRLRSAQARVCRIATVAALAHAASSPSRQARAGPDSNSARVPATGSRETTSLSAEGAETGPLGPDSRLNRRGHGDRIGPRRSPVVTQFSTGGGGHHNGPGWPGLEAVVGFRTKPWHSKLGEGER